MCGIIGYVGRQEAAPILLEGLERMEYRGYDSTGMAVCGDGVISCPTTSGLSLWDMPLRCSKPRRRWRMP